MLDSLITKSILEKNKIYLERLPSIGLSKMETQVIDWILDYEKKYGDMPTKERFEDSEYAHYWNEYYTSSPFDDVYDQTLEQLKNIWFNDQFRELQERLETGGSVGPLDFANLSKQISMFSNISVHDIYSVDRTELYSDTKPPNVMDYDWNDIQQSTNGIFPGEVHLAIARPGTGKSLISAHLAVKWANEGKRVLMISSEMAIRQMVSRFDAILAKFNPSIHRSKEDSALLKKYRNDVSISLDKMSASGGNILFPHQGSITLAQLRALISDTSPDVLIVDGVYLVSNGRYNDAGWQKEREVIEDLKLISVDYNIPVFATTQVNRAGGESHFGLTNIAGTDAYGWNADVVLGAWHFTDESDTDIEIKILKNRNGKKTGLTTLSIDWDTSTINEKKLAVGKR